MIASLNQSSSPSSLESTLMSAAMFTAHSCKAAEDQGRISLLINAQAHPTPFDGVTLAGDQIFDCFDPAARAGRTDLDFPTMEPELPRLLLRQCHCNSHGIVVRHRFLHVADNLAVVDLRKTHVARLQQSSIGSANSIELSYLAVDVVRPIPVPGLELIFLGIEVLLLSRYRLVLEQLETVIDAVTARQRRGKRETRLEHPGLTGLQVQGKNVGCIDEEIWPEIFPLRITRNLAQISLQLVLAGAPGKIGVRLGKAELRECLHDFRPRKGLRQENHV